MKKIKIVFAAFAVASAGMLASAQTSAAIDVLINDKDFKGEVIEVLNELVVDAAAAVAANTARAADTTVIINTNANIVLTTIVPTGTESTFLYAPNGTNITAAVNFTTSTNSWVTLVAPE